MASPSFVQTGGWEEEQNDQGGFQLLESILDDTPDQSRQSNRTQLSIGDRRFDGRKEQVLDERVQPLAGSVRGSKDSSRSFSVIPSPASRMVLTYPCILVSGLRSSCEIVARKSS